MNDFENFLIFLITFKKLNFFTVDLKNGQERPELLVSANTHEKEVKDILLVCVLSNF